MVPPWTRIHWSCTPFHCQRHCGSRVAAMLIIFSLVLETEDILIMMSWRWLSPTMFIERLANVSGELIQGESWLHCLPNVWPWMYHLPLLAWHCERVIWLLLASLTVLLCPTPPPFCFICSGFLSVSQMYQTFGSEPSCLLVPCSDLQHEGQVKIILTSRRHSSVVLPN